MHLETYCPMKLIVPFTVDALKQQDRAKVENFGKEVAERDHIHFEGYILDTQEPYSLDHAKATLFFD